MNSCETCSVSPDLLVCVVVDHCQLSVQGNFNFVQVLWHSMKINYAQSAADTRSVGAKLSNVAKKLVARRLISPSHLWCIGHSLGSHVCGHTSRKYRFARITGNNNTYIYIYILYIYKYITYNSNNNDHHNSYYHYYY